MTAHRDDGASGAVGPFATFVEHVRPGGRIERWESRHHRKHLGGSAEAESTWWAPAARGWWIGVLFAIGSTLFALGSVPSYAVTVGGRADSVTYFVGSIFFTTAGFLTYREAVDAGSAAPTASGRRRRVLVWQADRIDWWASGVQLVGTVFFNVSTFAAIAVGLTAEQADHRVWRPDVYGSICFLVASGLAWFEVSHGWLSWRPRAWSWWITLLNLVGSIAFGWSAVAAYVNPVTGDVRDDAAANLGTLVGAVCFLVGAILLLPERTEEVRAADPG